MKLGEWATCTAYLSPVHDGVFIEKIEGKRTESGEDVYVLHPKVEKKDSFDESFPKAYPFYSDVFKDKEAEEILSPCEGAYDLEKTYYERKVKRFKGVIVGIKDIVTEGYLGVDTVTDFIGREHQLVFKEAKTTVKCALVFFSMGKSRLVPLDDLVIDGEYESSKR